MSYRHLSVVERSKLEILHQQGKSTRVIAKELGRHHATIGRELRRNVGLEPYRAERSQEDYTQRRKRCTPAGKWTPEQAAIIEEKLQATWSPEQIVQRLRQEGLPMVCFKTIYRWLYTGRLVKGALTVLRHKGKRQRPAETRGKFTVVRRSLSVQKRFVPGKASPIGSWIAVKARAT
nr:IS30 family transposase [Paenibacillus senegalimassiliensis]